jgi:hypothetical protein
VKPATRSGEITTSTVRSQTRTTVTGTALPERDRLLAEILVHGGRRSCCATIWRIFAVKSDGTAENGRASDGIFAPQTEHLAIPACVNETKSYYRALTKN